MSPHLFSTIKKSDTISLTHKIPSRSQFDDLRNAAELEFIVSDGLNTSDRPDRARKVKPRLSDIHIRWM
jgi:hypothetical protein